MNYTSGGSAGTLGDWPTKEAKESLSHLTCAAAVHTGAENRKQKPSWLSHEKPHHVSAARLLVVFACTHLFFSI